MKKLLLLILLISFSLQAQEDAISKDLDSILNTDQAEMYLAANPTKGNKLITFNQEKHKTTLAYDLFERGHANTESDFEIAHYKVVESNSLLHYRVSYIFLDGNKLSTSEIQEKENQIRAKHAKGVAFSKLAHKYSMDSSSRRGGDSGWLPQGEMDPKFEDMVINSSNSIGDLFTVDIDNKQWHYIVLKTYDSKYIKEVKALKLVEKKS